MKPKARTRSWDRGAAALAALLVTSACGGSGGAPQPTMGAAELDRLSGESAADDSRGRTLSAPGGLRTGAMAPQFTFRGLDGRRRLLSSYRGKVVALIFWATYCGYCVAETPALVALNDRFAQHGLEIIGVAQDSSATVRRFVADHGITWPQAIETRRSRTIHDLYRVVGTPTRYLIDRDGTIVSTARSWREFERAVEAVILE